MILLAVGRVRRREHRRLVQGADRNHRSAGDRDFLHRPRRAVEEPDPFPVRRKKRCARVGHAGKRCGLELVDAADDQAAVPGRIDQAGVFHGSACHETERLRDDAPPVAGATGRHGSTPEASGSSWSRASPMSRRQPPHFGRDVRRQRLPGRFLADHRHNRVGHIVAGKGSRAGQHLEQHAPEGPDVGTLVDRFAARLLGRHVRGGAQNARGGPGRWQPRAAAL